MTGFKPRGVCPFGVPAGIPVWLDVSMKRFEYVHPADGNEFTSVKLSPDEQEKATDSIGWCDVLLYNVPGTIKKEGSVRGLWLKSLVKTSLNVHQIKSMKIVMRLKIILVLSRAQNTVLKEIGESPDDNPVVRMGQMQLFVQKCGLSSVVFSRIF